MNTSKIYGIRAMYGSLLWVFRRLITLVWWKSKALFMMTELHKTCVMVNYRYFQDKRFSYVRSCISFFITRKLIQTLQDIHTYPKYPGFYNDFLNYSTCHAVK